MLHYSFIIKGKNDWRITISSINKNESSNTENHSRLAELDQVLVRSARMKAANVKVSFT